MDLRRARTSSEPTAFSIGALPDELNDIAASVRRIGGRGATPESILIDKQEAADRIAALARQIGGR